MRHFLYFFLSNWSAETFIWLCYELFISITRLCYLYSCFIISFQKWYFGFIFVWAYFFFTCYSLIKNFELPFSVAIFRFQAEAWLKLVERQEGGPKRSQLLAFVKQFFNYILLSVISDIPNATSLEVWVSLPEYLDVGRRFASHYTQCRITYCQEKW